jgi:hypothetical protein
VHIAAGGGAVGRLQGRGVTLAGTLTGARGTAAASTTVQQALSVSVSLRSFYACTGTSRWRLALRLLQFWPGSKRRN